MTETKLLTNIDECDPLLYNSNNVTNMMRHTALIQANMEIGDIYRADGDSAHDNCMPTYHDEIIDTGNVSTSIITLWLTINVERGKSKKPDATSTCN